MKTKQTKLTWSQGARDAGNIMSIVVFIVIIFAGVVLSTRSVLIEVKTMEYEYYIERQQAFSAANLTDPEQAD